MKSFSKLFSSAKEPSSSSRKSSSTNKSKQRRIQEEDDDDEEEEEEDEEEENDDDDDDMVAEISENERWHSTGWGARNLSRVNGEWHYESSAGGSNVFPSPPLDRGWSYTGKW